MQTPSAPAPASTAAAPPPETMAHAPDEDMDMAAAEGSSEQEKSSETEEATGKGRKRQRVCSLGNMDKIPLMHRGDFEAAGAGMAKCLPCSWASKADCLVCLQKKNSVLSYLGRKKRVLTKAQRWQQQEANLPITRSCQHKENLEAWKQHKQQLALKEEQQANEAFCLLSTGAAMSPPKSTSDLWASISCNVDLSARISDAVRLSMEGEGGGGSSQPTWKSAATVIAASRQLGTIA
eukprot:1149994-Pelagomonas_calceolata.AAC.4